jgi:xanthine dehydrogenase accessory factor
MPFWEIKELLDRVHAPSGLGIGAETPEEITVSIMAEIIAEMRGNGLSV